jgi:hypothetical protein
MRQFLQLHPADELAEKSDLPTADALNEHNGYAMHRDEFRERANQIDNVLQGANYEKCNI